MTDLEELERLLAKATPGPWAYRPDEYDDWGVVKSPPREVGDYDPPMIMRGHIGQFRDPNVWGEDQLRPHRHAGTDPWEANARLIVALREAAPSLIAKAREADELRAENERLRGTVRGLIALAVDAGLTDDLVAQLYPDAKRKNGQPACDFAKHARRTINEARAALGEAK